MIDLLIKLLTKTLESISSPVSLILLCIVVGMGFYIRYKDGLILKKDEYIEKLTDKVVSATETLAKLTALVETLVSRGK